MKANTEAQKSAQKLAVLVALVAAATELTRRNGESKTWKTITEFKARKALKVVLGRAPSKDEVNKIVNTIKPVKGAKAAPSKPLKARITRKAKARPSAPPTRAKRTPVAKAPTAAKAPAPATPTAPAPQVAEPVTAA